jgi:hypothetical protein
MTTYEIIEEFNTKLIKATNGNDVFWIPMVDENADYQAYLNRDNPDWGKPLL